MRAIIELFTGKPFEVHTHYAVGKVHVLLEVTLFEMGYYNSKYRGISITSNQTEVGKLDFKADRKVNTALYVHVNGSIHPIESGAIVNGEIKLSKFSLGLGCIIFFVAMFVIVIMMMFSTSANPINTFLNFLVLACLFAMIYLLPCLYVQNKIYGEILDLLAEPEKRD